MRELEATAKSDRGQQVELVSDDVIFSRYGRVLSRRVKYPNGAEHDFDVWMKNWRSRNEFVIVVPYDSRTKTFTLLYEYYPASHHFMSGLPGGKFARRETACECVNDFVPSDRV